MLLLQQQDGGASGENTAGPRPHNKGTAVSDTTYRDRPHEAVKGVTSPICFMVE